MRLLLVGANGQVGTELRTVLPTLGETICTTRSGSLDGKACEALDLEHSGDVDDLVARTAPDVVVNASAYTAVDRAESERDLAWRINAEAPAALARACAARGARLVHISTDYVFDGAATSPYREHSPVAPQGAYGASKAAGEAAVRDSGARALILRTAWVYALHGQNFLRTMLRLGGERKELGVVGDQIGCPTPAWLIAQGIAEAVAKDVEGTYHLVTRGQVSWHGFACAIFEEAHARGLLARVPHVREIETSAYPTPARRPAYSVLDPSAFEAAVNMRLPGWRQALATTFDAALPVRM